MKRRLIAFGSETECLTVHISIWRASADMLDVVVGCFSSSHDKQSNVRNCIEDQKDDFKNPEERVNDHVESFSGDGKPFALRTIHQIRGQYTHCDPEDQQSSVYDCTPHEECCECLNIHDASPLSFCIQLLNRLVSLSRPTTANVIANSIISSST